MHAASAFAISMLCVCASACANPGFHDNFDHLVATPDGSRGWMTTFPYGPPATRTLPNNHEAECYVDRSVGSNPFSTNNGILTIAATPARSGNVCGLPYNSGLITTFRSFARLYGVFQMRAKLPAGAGLWPAWWLLPADNLYTSELDAFEVLGSNPSVLYFTTHGFDSTGKWVVNSQALNVPDLAAGFHIYTLTWNADRIALALDGKPIASAPTPASMHVPMFMLIDLAVGGDGSWPGPPNGSTSFPARMQIDWIRVSPLR